MEPKNRTEEIEAQKLYNINRLRASARIVNGTSLPVPTRS